MKKLTLFLLFSAVSLFVLASCKENKTPSGNVGGTEEESANVIFDGGTLNYSNVDYVEGSIHQFDMVETSNYVVSSGRTEYKILISETASTRLNSYVGEFVGLFKEATDIELEIVSDADGYDENGKYFSIGETKLFEDTNLELDYDQIKSQGYIIKTVGSSIIMSGFTDQACLNACYTYMNLISNYLYLGPETYLIDTGLTDVKLYNYDVIDAPDIEYRIGSYDFADDFRKYRLIDHGEHVIAVNGNHYHNTFDYLNPDVYKPVHPEWYSTDGTQLCYTARGDAESLKLMQEEVFKVMKDHLIRYPNNTAISFTIQDKNTFCECNTCSESYEKYNGSNAAVVVKFLNTISDMVDEWFEGEGAQYKRELRILFFAYLSTNKAPTTYDEATGKYVPIDDSVICKDNVCPYFADVRGDYTRSFFDATSQNKQFAESMKAWTELSTNLYFWSYSTNFTNYLTPYNSFDAMVDTYKFAVSCDAMYLFEQAQIQQGLASTGWSFLKQYITARCAWDCNADINDVYDEFFSEFYSKEAGPIMRELFDEYRVVADYQTNILGYTGGSSIYHNPFIKEYWPKNTLINWINRFDDALEEIEIYKDADPGKYEKYYGHITSERVQYTYLLLKIYGSSLSAEESAFYKTQFHSDAEGNGMLWENESRNPAITDILK